MTRKLEIDFNILNNQLKIRNLRFLIGQEYINAKTKYFWQCLICDYIWQATYDAVIGKKQTGCPECAGNRFLNLSIDAINEKLKDRNIICLSEKYNGSLFKYNWKCLICGNIWKSSYNRVINNKSGCLLCSYKIYRSKDKHPRWKNSKKDYPSEWTESKRESIRNRDNRECQFPDCDYTDIGAKRKLDVHHIDGNKFNCDDYNLISLCLKHHMKIEHSPSQWQNYFYTITESYNL